MATSNDPDNNDVKTPIPKTNITLETSLIDEIKDFIEKKKGEDQSYPYRRPTSLIREAIRAYIFPQESAYEDLQDRIKILEDSLEKDQKMKVKKSKEKIAEEEQKIYLRCVAMLLNIFDKNLDVLESFKIAMETIEHDKYTALEYRELSRTDMENVILNKLNHPPKSFKNAVQSNKLFPLLMMFLFLCNFGYTRKQDIIDPMAPMSRQFLEIIKEMIEEK